MSSLDFDLDSQMSHLETEWRRAYETSIAARDELQALVAAVKPNPVATARAQMIGSNVGLGFAETEFEPA